MMTLFRYVSAPVSGITTPPLVFFLCLDTLIRTVVVIQFSKIDSFMTLRSSSYWSLFIKKNKGNVNLTNIEARMIDITIATSKTKGMPNP